MSKTRAIDCSQSPSVHCMHAFAWQRGLYSSTCIDSTSVLRTLDAIKILVCLVYLEEYKLTLFQKNNISDRIFKIYLLHL